MSCHCHGLDLVVGDVKNSCTKIGLNPLQFDPQIGAELGVERTQRLVHQIDRRIAHQCPPDADALHLAA